MSKVADTKKKASGSGSGEHPLSGSPDLNRSSSQPAFSGKLKKLFFGRAKSELSTSTGLAAKDSSSSPSSSDEGDKGKLDHFLSNLREGVLGGPSLEIPANLHLTKGMLARILQELRTMPAIERVVLPDFQLDESAFAVLNEGMDGNWTLKTINLNHVIKPSWKGLEDFMRTTLTLQTLELSEQGMPPETKEVIRKYLEENSVYPKVIAGERTRLIINRRGIKDLQNIKPLLRSNLVSLNLSDNFISCITDQQLESLTGLEELILRNNQLRTLPAGLGQLCKLKKLDVSSNKLANLPPEAFCRLTCLTSLDVSNNKLSDLFSLVNLPKSLKKLLAFGNPLSLPNEVLDEGDRLIPYLRTFQSGVKQCYRTKLMIVGGDKTGKTNLAYALVNKKPKKLTSAVEGVDIIDWQVKTSVGTVECSVWDFAGSDVHYNQFFISQRALYVIVFRLTDTKDDLLHWLQTLEARAKESLVVIVGTHYDKVDKKKAQSTFAELKSKYSAFENVIDYVPVSSKTGKGLEDLRLLLLDAVLNQMPHLPETVPETYLQLEQTLKEICDKCRKLNEPPVKTFGEFTTIAGACGITDEEVALAAGYLNNMGVIAYFRRVTSKEYVVLDPRWIINMFSAIVAAKETYMKQGLLDIRDLRKHIWKPPAYPENLHDFMIALLQKFELVYKLPAVSKYRATYNQSKFTHEAEARGARGFLAFAAEDQEEENDTSSGVLLFPSMLEDFTKEEYEEKVHVHWPLQCPPSQQELGRNYHFNFLPLGLVSRLVARFLNTSGWEPLVYWKNGILMVKSAGKQSPEDALRDMMLLSGKQYYLTFNVRGKNPGMHLVNLAESIETLVLDSLGIPVRISCTCTHCLKEGNPHPFLFPVTECERAVAEGNGVVLCNYRRQINVSDIAPDISLSGVPDLPHISHGEMEFGKQIGEGAFAQVFIGTYQSEQVAVKKLTLGSSHGGGSESSAGSSGAVPTNNLDVFTDFRREVLLMSSLRHKNIVALKGVVMEPFCVVMELMPHGTLFELIHDSSKELDTTTALSLARDVSEAMFFLHNIPLVHRDLKSPNILLCKDSTVRYVAKVADFGLSRKVLLTPSLKGKVVDNPVWLAPEAIRGEAFSFASDVYAFGVILWELFKREKFFGDLRFSFQIEDAVLNGERPPLPEKGCPADCIDLITECWDGAPEKRPSFEKIIERLTKVESKQRMIAAAKKKAEEAKAAAAAAAAAAASNSTPTPST